MLNNIQDKIKISVLGLLALILFIGAVLAEIKLKERRPEIMLLKPLTPANIVVNSDKVIGPLPMIWQALSQGGEEAGVRMLQPAVSFVQRLKTNYIRIDHIFDDGFYGVVKGRNPDNSLALDWTRLDATVKDILATGATPFFCLSYMPGLLAPSLIDNPSNWTDWQDLIKQTVAHYSSQIQDVYYEVWNEPSLDAFGGFKMYGEKDYRLLYKYAALGAAAANAKYQYKIGGPAIPEMDTNWFRLLFDYVLENNLRLDFLSWHRYNLDPAQFVSDVYNLNVLISEEPYRQFSLLPKIISEWGPNSDKDPIYASPIAASHAVAALRQLFDKINWMFSFEVIDGPGQNNKGWGLLTNKSVGVKEKPRFTLYEWLANFKGDRVELLGENNQITGLAIKNERTITVLLTNFTPSGGTEESFQTTIAGLTAGRYRLSNQQLFKEALEQEFNLTTSSIVLNLNMEPYSVVKLQLTQI